MKDKTYNKLRSLIKTAYKKGGSYEDSYIYLMNGLNRITEDLRK
jgi:hypothetical protein